MFKIQFHLKSHRAFCLTNVDEIVNKTFLYLNFGLLGNLKTRNENGIYNFRWFNVYFA